MKRVVFLLFVLFYWLSVHAIVFAHGNTFFEFAPDTEKSLNTSLGATPAQQVYPPNDFLDGFDIWYANTGTADTATFELRNDQNTLLGTKTVLIPTRAHTYSGTKLHIDFGSLIPIDGTRLYRLRVVTDLTNFYLYYADQFQILEHNGVSNPSYRVEPALLGSASQSFAFKYALYESVETVPPVLSNATATVPNPYLVKFIFNANEGVDYRADLTPTQGGLVQTSYLGTYTQCIQGVSDCILSVNVAPGTTYQFTLFARDEWGNLTSFSGSVSTPIDPNTLPSPPPGGTPNPPPPNPPPPTPPNTPPITPPPPVIPPPVTPPPVTPPPVTPPTQNPPPITPPPTSGGSGNNPVQVSGGTTSSFDDGEGITITWTTPENLEGVTGYLIQVRDENDVVVQEIKATEATRKVVLEKLAPGKYRVIVYMERNGILEQLGEPISFSVGDGTVQQPFSRGKIILVIFLVLTGIGIAFGVLYYLRLKKRPPKPTERSKSIFDKIKDTP